MKPAQVPAAREIVRAFRAECAERIASSLGVTTSAIFPSVVGWVGPLPDRGNRKAVAS